MRRLDVLPASRQCGCGLDSLHGQPWVVNLPVPDDDAFLARSLAHGIAVLCATIQSRKEPVRPEVSFDKRKGVTR